MQITTNSIETRRGPSEWFTGAVYLDTVAAPSDGSRLSASSVHFTPGARTAWHTHARGQTLFVTEGKGLVQPRGGDIVTITSGDVVHAPADEWHWHGAAPDHFMTHLSITEGGGQADKPDTEFGAHVTDAEYRGETP